MVTAHAVRRDKEAAKLVSIWPQDVPGLRLGVDADTGEGYLAEPLHGDEYVVTREVVTARKLKLEPAAKRFPADKATWLFWIKRAVESGAAKVIAGKLPDEIEGEPKTAFMVQHQKSSNDRLAEAINKQTEMFGRLLAELVSRKK
jgi:hypothetical protein